MSKKKVKQGLSLVMSLLLCVTSANFSMLASAAEPNAARIIGFNQLDESIASQNLPVGASIDDVIFPESIKATVETVEEVEVKKLIEKEKPDEVEDEEVVSTDEDVTDVETEDKAAEPEEKAEETTEDETIVEEEPTEPEAEQPEEIPAEETTVSEPEATEDTEKEEAVDSSFIDILFPAMIVHAAEQEEEPALVSGAMAVSTEAEYETVVEKKVVHSEITISDVKWKIENGTKFDSSKEASFVFKPVFNTDYTINAETPTIKVNIVNTDSKTAFEKSQVVDGVRVNVKADPGVFPEGATLSVAKVSGQELQAVEEAVDEARADAKNKVESYTFDIKVLDKDGNEIEPDNSKGQVKVSFTLEEVADVNLDTDVYHVKGEVGDLSVDKLDAEEVAATTVEAVTDGFSFYTVEFTYNDLQYVMDGDTTVALSEILSAVGLEGEVSAATSNAPGLFSVAKENDVWYVTANQAFDTEQKLFVTIGGNEYVIVVTDDVTYDLWVGGVQVTSSNMNNITGADTPTAIFVPGDSDNDNKLYLTNFSAEYTTTPTWTKKAIIYDELDSLTIVLAGTNVLTLPAAATGFSCIIVSDNCTLTIDSAPEVGGSLQLTCGYNGIRSFGKLIIQGGTITNSGEKYGISLGNSSTDISNPAMVINGGDITLSGAYAAMSISGATVINGGTVNLESKAMDGSTGAPIALGEGVKAYKRLNASYDWTEVIKTGNYSISDFPYNAYFGAPIINLWVAGLQVNNTNKDNITGADTLVPEAKYDSDTNTLYLTDFNANFDSPSWDKDAIIYNGMNNLTINLTGTNNLSLTGTADNYHCIRSSTALNIEGTGSLHLNGGKTGIFCFGQLSIEDVSITNENEQYGIDSRHSGGLVSAPPIRFDGANINLSGTGNSIYTLGSVIVVNSGTVILGKPALANNENKKVVLGDGIKAYGKTNIIDEWSLVEKTDNEYKFSDFDGKYIRFGPKFEQVPLSPSEAFDAIGVDFENETVSPVSGYEVSSSNESYVPVTSLTELLDSDNPAIYVRKAETTTALASPWTEIVWPRPAAPSGIEGGAEEIIGTTTDMEYTKVGESTYTTASNTTTAVRAGEYLIRLKAGILNFASKPVKVVVYANEPVQETKDPQNPPTADQFTVTNAMPGKSDGAISGVTKAMEYSADNGDTWTLIKANPLTGLAAGTYLIRYAETAEKEASDSIAIKVDEKETGTISILVKPDNPDEQRSFEIRVEKGNSIVATRNFGKISEAGSTVTFEDLEVGIYNIICLSTNEEFAETKLLTVEKGKVTDIAFTVLPGEIKTLVTVGEDAPAVAVDGLSSLLTPEEKEAAANGDKAITVELTAEKAPETATGVEDIKNIMTPGQTIDTVLDLSLIKITKDLNTNEETKNDIGKDNDKVLEIAIPYDVADGKEISIFRYHEDANGGKTTKQFSSLSGRLLAGLYEDAKFFFDRIKKYIYLYASDFSTYAIAISDSSETAAAATSSGSGSDSASGIKTVPVYRLFNPAKGYHFYTADAAERDALVAAGWNDEGTAWQAGDKNGKAVYRLFDVNGTGGHLFTTSEEEKADYMAKGYRDEGIGWYAPSYAGRKVYKITNKTNGQVLYTISMDEKNALEAAGFICEEAEFVVY